MSLINLKGNDIVVEKVTAISKVKTIKTGKSNCDWDYGFIVYLEGAGEIPILVPTATDRLGNNHLSREDRVSEANKVRNKLMEKLK